MKALSLTQPWAGLVVDGVKHVETRSWSTPYRGPLAIHASLRMTQDAYDLVADLKAEGRRVDVSERGLVLGTVELVDVVRILPARAEDGVHRGWRRDRNRPDLPAGKEWPLTELEQQLGDYTPGRFAWLLADPTRLRDPLPRAGSLGLWECPL